VDELISCLDCSKTVQQDGMKDTEGKLCYHNYVCADCYENLENDN
jgi:DNA-directed RNA polymerase subunit RPC12/RpoP